MLFKKIFFKKVLAFSVLSMVCTSAAHADFHKWEITELFSNADGNIQFIEFFTPDKDQEFLGSSTDMAQLSSTDGTDTHFMTSFPNDLSGDTTDQSFLIATSGFASLAGAVTPDYIMPNGFLFIGGGIVTFFDVRGTISTVTHLALPTDGILSINAVGTTGTNTPTNFAGNVGSVNVPTVVPVPAAVWLFASGLFGLVGIARRRGRQQ